MKLFLRSLGLLLLYITATHNLCFSRFPLPAPASLPLVQPFTFSVDRPYIFSVNPPFALPADTAILIASLNVQPEEPATDVFGDFKDIPATGAAAKSCACEVLKVNSKNQRNLRIAVLVEKTSIITESDRALVRQLLEKEKRYMKYFFYEEMKTLSNMVAPVDCQTLYKKLHASAASLQLYQVLDADIKRQL